jgi:hypothetical protein
MPGPVQTLWVPSLVVMANPQGVRYVSSERVNLKASGRVNPSSRSHNE